MPLWETAAMKRLFKRDTDADTVNAVQFGPIPDVRATAPDTPGELWSVVRKALERNRDNRYPSARALLADLGGFGRTRDQATIPSRIAQLLEQLFADEKRRQRGWRKPAIRPHR